MLETPEKRRNGPRIFAPVNSVLCDARPTVSGMTGLEVYRKQTILFVHGHRVGEMGEDLLLNGERAIPEKLDDTGFRFLRSGLEESLRFQLGRLD